MTDTMDKVHEFEMLDDWMSRDLACEGEKHPEGKVGHDGGPARWRIKSPCGCRPAGTLLCDGRALHLRNHPIGSIGCGACKGRWPTEQWQFMRI